MLVSGESHGVGTSFAPRRMFSGLCAVLACCEGALVSDSAQASPEGAVARGAPLAAAGQARLTSAHQKRMEQLPRSPLPLN